MHEVNVQVGKQTVTAADAVTAAKPKLQVCLAVDIQVACVLTNEPHLSRDIVVEVGALCASQLAAHRKVIFRIMRHASLPVHQFVGTQFVCTEERYAHLCPLVEAFAKGNAECVAHGKPARLVPHCVAIPIVRIGVVVFCRTVSQILMFEVAYLESVYNARNRNKLLGHGLRVMPCAGPFDRPLTGDRFVHARPNAGRR